MPARHPALLLICLCTLAPPLQAATPEQVHQAALAFLQTQAAGLPGQARLSVAPLRDQQQFLADCDTLEAFLPQGQQLWGRVTLGVRCKSQPRKLPVHLNGLVQIHGRYLVASRSLSGAHTLGPDDFQWREGELTRHPPDLITRPEQLLGRSTRQAISRAQPLRSSYLQHPQQVQSGQEIKVFAQGPGFSVQNSGRALHNAAPGERLRVKLDNGRILTGTLRADGSLLLSE